MKKWQKLIVPIIFAIIAPIQTFLVLTRSDINVSPKTMAAGTSSAVSAPGVFVQSHYRWYLDNNGANTATAAANEDSVLNWVAGVNVRIRIQQYSPTSSPTTAFKLQFSKDGSAYADVATSLGVDFGMSDSPFFSNGTSTTARLTFPGGSSSSFRVTFTPGTALDTSITTTTISTLGRYWENEWCIQFPSKAMGHTYTFRVVSTPSSYSTTYNVTPTITFLKLPSFHIEGNSLHLSGATLRISAQ